MSSSGNRFKTKILSAEGYLFLTEHVWTLWPDTMTLNQVVDAVNARLDEASDRDGCYYQLDADAETTILDEATRAFHDEPHDIHAGMVQSLTDHRRIPEESCEAWMKDWREGEMN